MTTTFCIAIGSQITPRALVEAGFKMKDFRFSPASLEEVRRRLTGYTVVDESTPFKAVYRIN